MAGFALPLWIRHWTPLCFVLICVRPEIFRTKCYLMTIIIECLACTCHWKLLICYNYSATEHIQRVRGTLVGKHWFKQTNSYSLTSSHGLTSSNLISSYLILSHLILSHLISSDLISRSLHLVILSHLILSHITSSSHLISSHLTSPHLDSSHLISYNLISFITSSYHNILV